MLAAIIILFVIILLMLVYLSVVFWTFKDIFELINSLCEVDKRQLSIDEITNDILESFNERIIKLEDDHNEQMTDSIEDELDRNGGTIGDE